MTFPSVDAARDWSRKHVRQIYVEIEGVDGVLEVWPGGRSIWFAADMGKPFDRYRRRLTPDKVFAREGLPE